MSFPVTLIALLALVSLSGCGGGGGVPSTAFKGASGNGAGDFDVLVYLDANNDLEPDG